MRKVSILGVTGSVGINTIDLILKNRNKYRVLAITGYNNYKLLSNLAIKLNCKYAVIGNEKHFTKLKKLLKETSINCMAGYEAIIKVASYKTDIIFSNIVGLAGLQPTLSAIKNTKIIALANKESIVCAGDFIMTESKKYNTKIIPLDSEHNALFKILDRENPNNIKDITITASGGPFLKRNISSFKNITIKEALNHPNWEMGKKISVDSATMMNKVLEIIEASVLFNLNLNKIRVLIHPDSFIHAIVNYIDGTSFLIASKPDMKIPINYALNWPNKIDAGFTNMNLEKIGTLKFFDTNAKKFPALDLLKFFKNRKYYYSKAIVINAANEVAVNSFLEKKISFLDIVSIITRVVKEYNHKEVSSLKDIFLIDKEIRVISDNIINNKNK